MDMEKTQNLRLPLLYQGQLNKDITINTSLLLIDCLLNSALETLTPYASPPTNLQNGMLILTSETSVESFADFKNHIAFHMNGWHFIKPKEGLILWVKDVKKCVVFDGTTFQEITSKSTNTSSSLSLDKAEIDDLKNRIEKLENPTKFGINASADANNKLTVRSNYSLFNSESGDVRLVLNKQSGAGKTASFIFQSNWNGIAEFGAIYGDNFILKVASDGSWKEVFEVDAKMGSINFKQTVLKNGVKVF